MSSFRNISFVMPVLNEERHLAEAVASVYAQEVPGEMELVLCLGPSKDKTNEVARGLQQRFPHLQLTQIDVSNTSLALNTAIKKAKHEVVLRVDAHSKLGEGYAIRAIRVLNETQAANVGGVMVAQGVTSFEQAVAFAYNNRIGLGGGAYHVGAKPGPQDSVYLGVFDKSKLLKVGGFDANWIRGQDWELNLRLRDSGYLVWFDPDLKVTYRPRSSWLALAKQFFSTGTWRGALTRRSPADAAFRYWIPPLLVLSLLFVIPLWLYLIAIAFVATTAAGVSGRAKILLILVLPTMHLSWGLGFWLGFIRKAI